MRRICVYCGSRPGRDPAFAAAARGLAGALAERGLELVYGGGGTGLMGVLATEALARGVRVTGVIPRALVARELAHAGLDELVLVDSMHERKARMEALSDGFVALPGGFGTADETFEMLTWSQLGFHAKPVGLVDVRGFFAPLLAFVDHATAAGFIDPAHRALLVSEEDPSALLARMVGPRELAESACPGSSRP